MAEENTKEGKEGLFGSILEMFDLNTLFSLADPELDRLAKSVADVINHHFPKASRNIWLRRIWGVLSSKIESFGKGKGKVQEVLLEKASDLMDRIDSHLGEEPVTSGPHQGRNFAREAVLDWRERLLEDVSCRLREARSEPARVEALASIKEEFLLLKELESFMKDADAPSPKPNRDQWERDWKKFRVEATGLLEKTATYLETLPGAKTGHFFSQKPRVLQ